MENMNFSDEKRQEEFGQLPPDQKDTILSQQHSEANVVNNRLDTILNERNRLTTEGYATSERTEVLSDHINGLQMQSELALRMGDLDTADALEQQIANMWKEKNEAAEQNVKQAFKALMDLLPSLKRNDPDALISAPQYDESMISKMANLMDSPIAKIQRNPVGPRDVWVIQLTSSVNGKPVFYARDPKKAQIMTWDQDSFDRWVNEPES